MPHLRATATRRAAEGSLMAKRRVGTHAYHADPNGVPDHNGDIGCAECFLPKRNTIHDLPATTQEARDRDAAILGEQNEEQ